MKSKVLSHFALSVSLLLVACAPQPGQQPVQSLAQPAPAAQSTENVMFSLAKAQGLRTQFADLADAAFFSLSLVGDGISGPIANEDGLIPIDDIDATARISGLPIQPGHLRVVTAIAYDSDRKPLQAFIGKGFYKSKAGVTEIRIEIDRTRWLTGRALELLLASDPKTASGLDLEDLQAAVSAALGSNNGSFLYDPTLFDPAILAELLSEGEIPSGQVISGKARIDPGELLLEFSTTGGGNFGESLTVVVNDPNSGVRTISAGTVSPVSLFMEVSPGTWTLEVRHGNGEVVTTRPVVVNESGTVTSGNGPATLSGIIETPVIESLSTTATTIGSTVTLTGRGFSATKANNTVMFGNTQAAITGAATPTSLDVTVPDGISGGLAINVEVSNTISNSRTFAVVPLLTSVVPDFGPAGTSVTLTGSGFSTVADENTVRFGAVMATVSGSPGNTSLTATAPVHALGTEDLTLTVGSQTSNKLSFRFIRGEFLVNTYLTSEQGLPDVAMDDDGDFVITWQSLSQDGNSAGIYAQRFDSAGVAQDSEFQVNTFTTNSQANPQVAMDADGNFVIAWNSNSQDSSNYGVYARRYTASGQAQGSEFLVNTNITGRQGSPAVAMDADGDFVIAWESRVPYSNYYDIFAQRYNASGQPQGSEFLVNSYTTSNQLQTTIAMNADGNFVIAWESNTQDGNTEGIFAQRFNSSGQPQGSEFQVNTFGFLNQVEPNAAMDSDGDFVITWVSLSQDGNEHGVFAQRYNASGQPQGSEFQVNTYTTSAQTHPDVAFDTDGNFTIVWESTLQENSRSNIYAQHYNSSGVIQGSEFRVNPTIANQQNSPALAFDGEGDSVFVWSSDDGSTLGVYALRFNAAGEIQ
ncbi:MAG: IPT/TIG domain-containing protein [Candidatus Sericytochromatia bacterium]